MLEDGGFFAIRGFNYQFFLTLNEIFKSSDDKYFALEGCQDFDANEEVYQVKNQENQKYYPSSIKSAVIRLIAEFEKEKRKYILFACFKDKVKQTVILNSISELNNIIQNCQIGEEKYSFSDEIKKDFISNFKIEFSSSYFDEKELLLNLIASHFSVSKDRAEMYCYTLISFLSNIVVAHGKKDRCVTKKQLNDYISTAGKEIFYDYYKKYKSNDEYLKFLKNEHFFEKNITSIDRFFVFNCSDDLKPQDAFEIVVKIKDKFFVLDQKGKGIKSPPPYILFKNYNKLSQVKKLLYENKTGFSDGFPYKDSEFIADSLLNLNPIKESKSVRILSSTENFITLLESHEKSKKIFEFAFMHDIEKIHDEAKIIFLNDIKDIKKILA